MSKVRERLRSKVSGQKEKPAPAAKPEAPASPPAKPAGEEPEQPVSQESDEEDLMGANIGEEEKAGDQPQTQNKEDAQPAAGDKKPKVNPWKLIDEHKAARAALEKEISDTRKLIPNAEQRKAELVEIETLKKRNEELEKHIQFVDYQQSEEFKTKYDQPYKTQWSSSMNELKGVMVETETGEREIEPADMVALVNMTKTQARAKANELFGDFSNDVMNERDKIRSAWDSQQQALKQAKENGVARAQEAQKTSRENYEKLNSELHEIYAKAVDSISKDARVSEFITQKNGDSKHNELLTRGLEMVDEAFKTNPMDPNLTQKQRESLIKKHAAVRFRAAGYGPLKHAYSKLLAAYKEQGSKLAEYEGTTPNRGGSEPSITPVSGGSKMAQMQARLRARAKPTA